MEYNGNIYYYQYNLQGDVTGLYDSNFNKVVYYLYDSWGKLLEYGGSMANTVGTANPFRYRGYYYDEESGFYYLNSRYYDPETGRFINADGILGVNPDMTTYNLFAYCGNNPTNNHDTSGERYERDAGCFCGGWGFSEPNITRSYASDVGTVFIVATTIAVAQGLSTPAMRQEMFALRLYNKEQAKAKEKEQVKPTPPPSTGTTYYHSTTLENALAIIATNTMLGNKWEGGYVYAWRTKPSKYAINNSGARKGVLISFKTNASFTTDTGISNPLVKLYGPVVSTRPGPIAVWDVKIVVGG